MTALTSIRTDNLGTRQGVCPMLFLNIPKVELECILVLKRVLVKVSHELTALCRRFLCQYRNVHAAGIFPALHSLLTQLMRGDGDNGLRINLRTIYHDAESEKRLVILTPDNGYRISCFHLLSDLYQVLGIMSINGLQSIVVSHNNDITMTGNMTRESYRSIEHCLHGITLGGFYLQFAAIRDSLAYWQRKRILTVADKREVDIEHVTLGKQSRSGNANLLLFRRSELVGGRRG